MICLVESWTAVNKIHSAVLVTSLLSHSTSQSAKQILISIGWLCSYALYFPVWFMLQKTYLFLLNFFLQFLLKFFYWGITALHCCVSAVQQSEPVIHIWISPPSWNSLLHPPSHTINFLDIYLHFTHDSLTFLCYKIFCLEQIMLVKFMPEYITPWKINNRAGMLC